MKKNLTRKISTLKTISADILVRHLVKLAEAIEGQNANDLPEKFSLSDDSWTSAQFIALHFTNLIVLRKNKPKNFCFWHYSSIENGQVSCFIALSLACCYIGSSWKTNICSSVLADSLLMMNHWIKPWQTCLIDLWRCDSDRVDLPIWILMKSFGQTLFDHKMFDSETEWGDTKSN